MGGRKKNPQKNTRRQSGATGTTGTLDLPAPSPPVFARGPMTKTSPLPQWAIDQGHAQAEAATPIVFAAATQALAWLTTSGYNTAKRHPPPRKILLHAEDTHPYHHHITGLKRVAGLAYTEPSAHQTLAAKHLQQQAEAGFTQARAMMWGGGALLGGLTQIQFYVGGTTTPIVAMSIDGLFVWNQNTPVQHTGFQRRLANLLAGLAVLEAGLSPDPCTELWEVGAEVPLAAPSPEIAWFKQIACTEPHKVCTATLPTNGCCQPKRWVDSERVADRIADLHRKLTPTPAP